MNWSFVRLDSSRNDKLDFVFVKTVACVIGMTVCHEGVISIVTVRVL